MHKNPVSTTESTDSTAHYPDDEGLAFPTTGKEMLIAMSNYYSQPLSDFDALMWGTQILGVYTDEQIIRACLAHMEGPAPARNFMPRYGDIKSIIEPEPSVLEIERLVRHGSPYQSPELKCPVLIEAINQLGGWERVCAQMPDAQSDPVGFSQYTRRVEKALAVARRQTRINTNQPAPLLGIVERMQPANDRKQLTVKPI